jgi:hypothetical protein
MEGQNSVVEASHLFTMVNLCGSVVKYSNIHQISYACGVEALSVKPPKLSAMSYELIYSSAF